MTVEWRAFGVELGQRRAKGSPGGELRFLRAAIHLEMFKPIKFSFCNERI